MTSNLELLQERKFDFSLKNQLLQSTILINSRWKKFNYLSEYGKNCLVKFNLHSCQKLLVNQALKKTSLTLNIFFITLKVQVNVSCAACHLRKIEFTEVNWVVLNTTSSLSHTGLFLNWEHSSSNGLLANITAIKEDTLMYRGKERDDQWD